MWCGHTVALGEHLSGRVRRVACARWCGWRGIAKPIRDGDGLNAANDFLCGRLIARLGFGHGVVPDSTLVSGTGWFTGVERMALGAFLADDIGRHVRIGATHRPEGAAWPSWLYWFDRWVGRVDPTGDTNTLLRLADNVIVPVDFEMAFPWVTERTVAVYRTDWFDVVSHPSVDEASEDAARDAIRRLGDADIMQVVEATPPYFAPRCALTAIWAGLCARRDQL